MAKMFEKYLNPYHVDIHLKALAEYHKRSANVPGF